MSSVARCSRVGEMLLHISVRASISSIGSINSINSIRVGVVLAIGTSKTVSNSIRKGSLAHYSGQVGLFVEARALDNTGAGCCWDTLEGVLVLWDFCWGLRQWCPNLVVGQVWLSRVREQWKHSCDTFGRACLAS